MKPRYALVFDWDKTLSPHYMQQPIFREYGVDEASFWKEAHRRTTENSDILGTTCAVEHEYMNLMVDYARNGTFKELNNERLKEIGKKITLCEGVEELFQELLGWEEYLDVYVITSGIAVMLDSFRFLKTKVYGSAFIDYTRNSKGDVVPGVINSLARVVTPSEKVNLLTSIAKGCELGKFEPCVPIFPEDYRVPYENMIYVGDGLTDMYAFNFLKNNGGTTVGVYPWENYHNFTQIETMRMAGLLDIVGVSDYTSTSSVGSWLRLKIQHMIHENRKEDSSCYTKYRNLSSGY